MTLTTETHDSDYWLWQLILTKNCDKWLTSQASDCNNDSDKVDPWLRQLTQTTDSDKQLGQRQHMAHTHNLIKWKCCSSPKIILAKETEKHINLRDWLQPLIIAFRLSSDSARPADSYSLSKHIYQQIASWNILIAQLRYKIMMSTIKVLRYRDGHN